MPFGAVWLELCLGVRRGDRGKHKYPRVPLQSSMVVRLASGARTIKLGGVKV